jgi:excisionase family DNA binding protein
MPKEKPMTAPMFVPINKVAKRFQVSESTVRTWVDRNILRGIRLPSGHRRIPLSEVQRMERELWGDPTLFAAAAGPDTWPKAVRHEVPSGIYPEV